MPEGVRKCLALGCPKLTALVFCKGHYRNLSPAIQREMTRAWRQGATSPAYRVALVKAATSCCVMDARFGGAKSTALIEERVDDMIGKLVMEKVRDSRPPAS